MMDLYDLDLWPKGHHACIFMTVNFDNFLYKIWQNVTDSAMDWKLAG